MKKMIVAIVAITVGTAAALPTFAKETKKCPEGYHWDATQQKCVKHGE